MLLNRRSVYKIICQFLVTCALWCSCSGMLEASELVRCSTGHTKGNHPKNKKITLCMVRLDRATFGNYLEIISPTGHQTLAMGKIVKQNGHLAIIMLTRPNNHLRPKLPVEEHLVLPETEIGRYSYRTTGSD